ncbi:MAG: hypothetical protein K5871_02090 [Lachnospiraceae bacterium]|nr:hypothetical protein [Lachnospiraceae bacterium]
MWTVRSDTKSSERGDGSFVHLFPERGDGSFVHLFPYLFTGAAEFLPLYKDGIKTYKCVDVNKYHKDTGAVKKMLSISAWLAKEAENRNYSLSKILQEALIEKIDIA